MLRKQADHFFLKRVL